MRTSLASAGLQTALVLTALVLTGCSTEANDDPPRTAPTTESAPVADQPTQLRTLADELRTVVDELVATVPAVVEQRPTGDRQSTCFTDQDNVERWEYGYNILFTGDPETVGQQAEALLSARGFQIRPNPSSQDAVAFAALRDGASIGVGGGTDEDRTIIQFIGYSACVSPDGTVDTTNPP